jgi:hypothetical protein
MVILCNATMYSHSSYSYFFILRTDTKYGGAGYVALYNLPQSCLSHWTRG